MFYEDALEAIYPDAVASAIEEAKLEPVDTCLLYTSYRVILIKAWPVDKYVLW